MEQLKFGADTAAFMLEHQIVVIDDLANNGVYVCREMNGDYVQYRVQPGAQRDEGGLVRGECYAPDDSETPIYFESRGSGGLLFFGGEPYRRLNGITEIDYQPLPA